MGHRTPYGLAFAPDGRLWEVEHGPRGGDEVNLIEPGKNYGWPLVSYAMNYNGVPIDSPDTRPDLAKPVLYWTPVIAPGNLMFYKGDMFPQWNGSALVSGLATMALVRITSDGKGGAQAVDRWSMGFRVRGWVSVPDGALWMVEDAKPGRLVRSDTAKYGYFSPSRTGCNTRPSPGHYKVKCLESRTHQERLSRTTTVSCATASDAMAAVLPL